MIRLSGPRVVALLVTLALVGYTFLLAPRLAAPVPSEAADTGVSAERRESETAAEPELFPPVGKAFIGVTTKEGTYDFGPVDRFQEAVKHRPAVMMFNHGWAVHDFDRAEFDRVAQRGMLPMLSWEPWNYKDDSKSKSGIHATQPEYRLSNIYGGHFDDYIREYALGIKSLDYSVAVRFAHEMNGFWYPWGSDVNGNQSGDYIKAWKHVREIFSALGVTNVIWVWSPNVIYDNTPLAPLYPGDDLVDWVGLSGYYGTEGIRDYRTPETIFNQTIAHLRAFTQRPIVITETGATDSAGLKARWVEDFFRYLTQHPDIIGFIWYESVREWDWRIASSPAAAAVFADQADDPRYATPWSKDVLPRTTVELPDPDLTASTTPGPRPSWTPTKAAPTPTASGTTGRPTPIPSPSTGETSPPASPPSSSPAPPNPPPTTNPAAP